MPNDRSERRMYRKSPGRQYGYDYDPLRSRNEQAQSGQSEGGTQSERWPSRNETMSRATTQLAQRPDLRRTRQLLRQNIIASKVRSVDEEADQFEPEEAERTLRNIPTEPEQPTQYNRRYSSRREVAQPQLPATHELMGEEEEGAWNDFADVDPDLGYEEEEDPLDVRMGYIEAPPRPSPLPAPRTTRKFEPERPAGRSVRPRDYDDDYEEYEDYDLEEEEEEAPVRRRKAKKKISRRGMLVGLGLAAVGGTGIAAYELGPKIPQAVSTAGANIEKQLQDAFNQGMAKGADQVRREFVTALDNLEGFTLDGAITAARLTRVAYDTFVSPIIEFGSVVSGEVLSGMLRAFKTARSWLAGASLDNATLAAIEKVLQTWVDQSAKMPKQINAITQADLEGAQAYLRALQRKLDDEKAILNGKKAAPTPGAQPTQQPTTPPKQ